MTARPHRTGPDPAHHVRIVERHDGQWKFAVIAFLDPGIGRPGSGHIRLDADGAVLWMDETATAAFEAEDDLLVRNGRLRVRDSRTNQKLQAAIHWAASLDYGVLPGRGALPVVLDVGEGVPARLWWVIADSGAIYFSFGQSGHTQQLDAAAAAFGLSAAQRIVAAHVVGGLSLSQIAEAMGVKPSTVRTHLDRIFEKTGVRNQTALVRVLLSASAPPL
jgi:DNA-binding CsgD family transcriptional regulator